MQNKSTFTEQINAAQHLAMQKDTSMLAMGLGINDPKAIFNTTAGLTKAFGEERVLDIPTSENAMTGVGIGAAIAGSRVLMTHQRVDFFLLAMDQLVNNAAKWHYMFNGTMNVPLTIRLIIGRGWGQGPTHQQSLQSWFTHIPGLKVVVPSLADNVGQLLYSAIMDNNPTIFLEHRWLHNQQCISDKCVDITAKPANTRVVRKGKNLTLISNSYMLLEVLKAADELQKSGVSCDVLDLCNPSHIDWQVIYESVGKTGLCLIADMGHVDFSVSSEVSAKVTENCFKHLLFPPVRLGLPRYPEPTSFALTKDYYPTADDVLNSVSKHFDINIPNRIPKPELHDIPGDWFKGPF
ncbi:alpha-ketoacid dehydrogenase subunit beta [Catenovulum sediminis]|uniref:Transketolase C-terminal domain-containing protein n=1 Tax=Catenovulum sediminis TaxID=1740262 RepID=A0ABV1RGX2_9ALTE